MKLVLKNKQEIEIAGMNNSFSFEKFKDGKGNELNYNSVGKTKRDFPGWKVDVITEDLSDRGSVITIKLGTI